MKRFKAMNLRTPPFHRATHIIAVLQGLETQGKRILIPQQMQEVVIVPPCFEAFPVDTAF